MINSTPEWIARSVSRLRTAVPPTDKTADKSSKAALDKTVTEVVAKVIAAEGDIDRIARVIAETDFETLSDNAQQLMKISGGAKKTHAAKLLLRAYDKGLKGSRIGSVE